MRLAIHAADACRGTGQKAQQNSSWEATSSRSLAESHPLDMLVKSIAKGHDHHAPSLEVPHGLPGHLPRQSPKVQPNAGTENRKKIPHLLAWAPVAEVDSSEHLGEAALLLQRSL